MKKQQRFKYIVEYLKDINLATVEDLVNELKVSPATIRRDLVDLDDQGVVRRTHGGVTLNNFVPSQLSFSEKKLLFVNEKKRIAQTAATHIESGMTVLLDAGTTTMEIAKCINHLPLRVITSDLRIALYLSQFKQIEVTVLGGQIDSSSQSCIGEHARRLLRAINTDIVFISCNYWSIPHGVTAPTDAKTALKIEMMACAKQKILVADSGKYNTCSLFKISDLDDFNYIVSDNNLENDEVVKLNQINAKVDLV